MFTSLVFEFYPSKPVALPPFTGHLAYSLFLPLVQEMDPSLSASFHDSQIKTFSISPLFWDFSFSGQPTRLPVNKSVFLRVSFVNADEFSLVFSLLQTSPPQSVQIGKNVFFLKNIHFSPATHRWARFLTIDALNLPPWPEEVTIRFLSITLFRAGKKDVFLPLPKPVFNSITRKIPDGVWKQCGVSIDNFTPEKEVILTRYALLTTHAARFSDITHIGFTGSATYAIAPQAKSSPALQKIFSVLSRCAFFTGVRAKTALGFGNVSINEDNDGERIIKTKNEV